MEILSTALSIGIPVAASLITFVVRVERRLTRIEAFIKSIGPTSTRKFAPTTDHADLPQ